MRNIERAGLLQSILQACREKPVAGIIADVRARGDAAVIELTAKFDRLELTPETLAFTREEIAAEVAKVSPEDRAALELMFVGFDHAGVIALRAVSLGGQTASAFPPHHQLLFLWLCCLPDNRSILIAQHQ